MGELGQQAEAEVCLDGTNCPTLVLQVDLDIW